jgi:hypothetical protein
VRLADQLAAVVEKRLTEQYDAGMQPAPVHPNAHVFAHGPCTHTARNLTASGAVMHLDAPPFCDNSESSRPTHGRPFHPSGRHSP